jgi:RHS repeat-associated protein
MLMPGRQYGALGRYGFNGKEQDPETKGSGVQYDYGFRIYDVRVGRFLSVDPLTRTYPWYTPYQFAGNKPIWATDVDGLEENTTSTYAKKPIMYIPPPTFKGVIVISNINAKGLHKDFEGNYAQLKKFDQLGVAPKVVDQLIGANIGTSASKLDIKQTGTRREKSVTWKGTDYNYYNQFSYTLSSNNVKETGTFEVFAGAAPVSARAWDPAVFLLLNKVVSSVIVGGLAKSSTGEMATLYRSISAEEAESIKNTGKLSLGQGMEAKQFWQTKEGLKNWNKTPLAGEYNLEITVPKSMIGKGKPLNTAVQPDEMIGPNVTIDRAEMETVNQSIKSFTITPIKK